MRASFAKKEVYHKGFSVKVNRRPATKSFIKDSHQKMDKSEKVRKREVTKKKIWMTLRRKTEKTDFENYCRVKCRVIMSVFQFCVLVPFVHALYMLACPQK